MRIQMPSSKILATPTPNLECSTHCWSFCINTTLPILQCDAFLTFICSHYSIVWNTLVFPDQSIIVKNLVRRININDSHTTFSTTRFTDVIHEYFFLSLNFPGSDLNSAVAGCFLRHFKNFWNPSLERIASTEL